MKLSASSLSDLAKCGYKYYLTRIQRREEPGKKSYRLMLGNIVHDAIQAGCIDLWTDKVISDSRLIEHLFRAYQTRYTEAGFPAELLEPIRTLLFEGIDPDAMNTLDQLSIAISATPDWEFKVPAPVSKKSKTGYSTNQKRLGMLVIKSLEDTFWFFKSGAPYLDLIREAAAVENELSFECDLGLANTVTINGKEVEEKDVATGRMDTLITGKDGSKTVLELKYSSTPYTQDLVDHKIQTNLYARTTGPGTRVFLADVKQNRWFEANITAERQAQHQMLYRMAVGMVRNNHFMPVCPTDPYIASTMMCGFKTCGGCEFAGSGQIPDEED